MIFKEDGILLPMVFDIFTDDEWKAIADQSRDLGYFLIYPPPRWKPAASKAPDSQARSATPSGAEALPTGTSAVPAGAIVFPTGVLKTNQLIGMLDTLPVDITFIDKDDIVRYFSKGSERIFARTKAVIGRRVVDCHPPASVHIVEGIIESFRAGRKDHEDFWIHLGEKYVFIRYFAVRDPSGAYLGVLEVTQDIKPIQAIQGEKRLVSE